MMMVNVDIFKGSAIGRKNEMDLKRLSGGTVPVTTYGVANEISVGVPDIVPVSAFRLRPGGNGGETVKLRNVGCVVIMVSGIMGASNCSIGGSL